MYVLMIWGESLVRRVGRLVGKFEFKTDGECETASIHAPFTWEFAPGGGGNVVALYGTNQIEATMLEFVLPMKKLCRICLLKLKFRQG